MKFTCEKAVLNEAISICIHAVATKSTIAVLEGLLITAEDELTLCGYNFKTGIKKTFPAEIVRDWRSHYWCTRFQRLYGHQFRQQGA